MMKGKILYDDEGLELVLNSFKHYFTEVNPSLLLEGEMKESFGPPVVFDDGYEESLDGGLLCNGKRGEEALEELMKADEKVVRCDTEESMWKIAPKKDKFLIEGEFDEDLGEMPEFLTKYKNPVLGELGQPTFAFMEFDNAFLFYKHGERFMFDDLVDFVIDTF